MTTLTPVSHKEYVAVLRPLLPDHIFKPVPHRLLWMLPHGLVIAGGIFAIVNGLGGIVGKLIAAILIGNSFTALGFLGHEIMHGAVTRKKMASISDSGHLLFALLGWSADVETLAQCPTPCPHTASRQRPGHFSHLRRISTPSRFAMALSVGAAQRDALFCDALLLVHDALVADVLAASKSCRPENSPHPVG